MSADLVAAEVEPAEGVHYELEEGEYRRLNRLSYSGGKIALRSMAHLLENRRNPKPSNDEQRFGTVFHAELLEPGRVASMIAVVPEDAPKKPTAAQLGAAKPSPAAVESIAWWKDFDARSAGLLVIDTDEERRLQGMLAATRAHSGAMRLLAAGRPEVSILWQDGRYDVPCKCRIDFLREDGGHVDIKTAADASPEGFARAAASFAYHMQAAAYFSGAEHALHATPPFWAWVVVEKEPPFGVATYVAQADALMAGAALWDTALARYRMALDTGEWPAYAPTIEPLQFPTWALRARNL